MTKVSVGTRKPRAKVGVLENTKGPTRLDVLRALVHELEEIRDWANVERAPLRDVELASIDAKIRMGKHAIAKHEGGTQ